MILYLKNKEEYIDRYDKMTVDHCRRFEKSAEEKEYKELVLKDGTKYSPEAHKTLEKMITELMLFFMTGDAYAKKEETINHWMEADKEKDRILESAQPPQLIRCKKCGSAMDFKEKHLWGPEDTAVLFFFECPQGCLPNRFVYENGKDWEKEKRYCQDCKGELDEKSKRQDQKILITLTCTSCGKVTKDEIDFSSKKESEDPDYEKDRARFCLTEEAGQKYIQSKADIKHFDELRKKIEEKEKNKDLYDKVAKIEKLSIPQVKKRIADLLQNEPYENLIFEQPAIERIVSVGFTVEDPTNQHEYDSKQKLTRLFKKNLEPTNWRLMSDGISYRLGVLSGKLRVYEKEEELIQIINRNDRKDKSK